MPRTAKDLIAEAKSGIEEIAPKDASKRLEKGAVAIDVREADELDNGFVPGAVHVPRGLLEMQISQNPATQDPDSTFILYCKGGGRCALATKTLKEMGYENVYSLEGGFGAWVEAGLPVQFAATEDDEQE